MPTPWLDASKREMVVQLSLLIKDHGAKFVVIDNLGLITGKADENSAEMAQVMGNLRWLCEECACAIMLIHHQRKTGTGGDKIRKGETLRGHSSIEASLDLAWLVERKEGDESVSVIPTKVRGFKTCDIFGAQFTYTHKAGTYDLATARFFSQASETPQTRERRAIKIATMSELNDFVSAGKAPTQQELLRAIQDNLRGPYEGNPPGEHKIRAVLKDLVQAKTITVEPGPHRALHYKLP
jgi:hypothetical protein